MPNYSCNKNITHSSRKETLFAFALIYSQLQQQSAQCLRCLQWIQTCQIYYKGNVPAQLTHCPHLIIETLLRQTPQGIRAPTYVYLHVVSTEDIP